MNLLIKVFPNSETFRAFPSKDDHMIKEMQFWSSSFFLLIIFSFLTTLMVVGCVLFVKPTSPFPFSLSLPGPKIKSLIKIVILPEFGPTVTHGSRTIGMGPAI